MTRVPTTGNDSALPGREFLKRVLLDIQSPLRLSLTFVGPVTLKTIVRQDRPYVAIEIDRCIVIRPQYGGRADNHGPAENRIQLANMMYSGEHAGDLFDGMNPDGRHSIKI